MAEVTFPEVKDRNVATPSRVRLTKAVGIEGDDIFDVEPIPGSVYEEGTPLNKEFFDKLKFYIDNNMGSSDNPVPVTNGGTGANTAEGARTNLDVYSKSEIDEEFARASAKIEPHINTRVTDTPEGVHGVYFDPEGRQWFDPDGDGTFETNYPVDNGTVTYEARSKGENPTIGINFAKTTDTLLSKIPKYQIINNTSTFVAYMGSTSYGSTSANNTWATKGVNVCKLNNGDYLTFVGHGVQNYNTNVIATFGKLTQEGVSSTFQIDMETYHFMNKPSGGNYDECEASGCVNANGTIIAHFVSKESYSYSGGSTRQHRPFAVVLTQDLVATVKYKANRSASEEYSSVPIFYYTFGIKRSGGITIPDICGNGTTAYTILITDDLVASTATSSVASSSGEIAFYPSSDSSTFMDTAGNLYDSSTCSLIQLTSGSDIAKEINNTKQLSTGLSSVNTVSANKITKTSYSLNGTNFSKSTESYEPTLIVGYDATLGAIPAIQKYDSKFSVNKSYQTDSNCYYIDGGFACKLRKDVIQNDFNNTPLYFDSEYDENGELEHFFMIKTSTESVYSTSQKALKLNWIMFRRNDV